MVRGDSLIARSASINLYEEMAGVAIDMRASQSSKSRSPNTKNDSYTQPCGKDIHNFNIDLSEQLGEKIKTRIQLSVTSEIPESGSERTLTCIGFRNSSSKNVVDFPERRLFSTNCRKRGRETGEGHCGP